MALTAVPTLDAIAADPTAAKDLPRRVLEDLALRAVTVHAAVTTALVAASVEAPRRPEDRLMTAKELAGKWQKSVNWVYTHADDWPFTVREAGEQPRFSLLGFERYLAARQAEARPVRKGA